MKSPLSQKFMSKKILQKRKNSKNMKRILRSRLSLKGSQLTGGAKEDKLPEGMNKRVNSLTSFSP